MNGVVITHHHDENPVHSIPYNAKTQVYIWVFITHKLRITHNGRITYLVAARYSHPTFALSKA